MERGTSNVTSSIDTGFLCILAGAIAVLVIVVGVEIGIDASMTTGISLDLSTRTSNAE